MSSRRPRAVTGPVHGLFLLPLLCLLLLPPACGPATFAEIRPDIKARGHYIEGVPFYRQHEHDCGPAALAGVYAYWGRSADLARLTDRVVLEKLGGSLPMDIERAAQEDGFRTAAAFGDRGLLFSSLKGDVPVICLLDLGIGPYRKPHYVIVLGFDDARRLFIMHDGVEPNRTMTYDRFDAAWTRAGTWMLIIRPQ